MNPPSNMTIVTKEEFFAKLRADRRDIMPSVANDEYTLWKSKNGEVFGWSSPGWKNPGGTKAYAVNQ